MNMQSQLQAAIAAAEKTLDDSSVASPVRGAANHDDDQSTQQPVADVVVPIVAKPSRSRTSTRKLCSCKSIDACTHLTCMTKKKASSSVQVTSPSIFSRAKTIIVKETNAVFGALYKYVNDMTVPWATGVRLLNANLYMEFSTELRKHVDDANSAVDKLAANWDTAVQIDYNRMLRIAQAKGKPNLANINDYPDVQTLRSKYGVDVQYMPVPTADGFDPRLGMSDADQASVQDRVNDAEANGAKYVINQMLEPMSDAVKKLQSQHR